MGAFIGCKLQLGKVDFKESKLQTNNMWYVVWNNNEVKIMICY